MLPPTDSKVWQTQLSFLSSLIVTLGILAYCAGYVVVNSYLSKYGIAPYDLLQPNYVSAGLLYLLSTVGFTSLMVFAHFQARNRREVLVTAWFDTALAIFIFFSALSFGIPWIWPAQKELPGWYQILGTSVFVFAFVLTFFPQRVYRFRWTQKYFDNGVVAFLVLLLMIIYTSSKMGFERFLFYPIFIIGVSFLLPWKPLKDVALGDLITGPLVGIGNLLLSMNLFGSQLYPNIPSYYGGGNPALISIALKPENREIIGQLLDREDWMCTMQNIAVLHENKEAYYVLPYGMAFDYPPVVVLKDQVAGAVYQTRELSVNYRCLDER